MLFLQKAKRSLSATPTSFQSNSQHEGEDELDTFTDIDIKPDVSDTTDSPKRSRAIKGPKKRSNSDESSATPSPKKRKSTSPAQIVDWKQVEGWTPEKKEAFMVRVIGAGMVAVGTQNLADEVNTWLIVLHKFLFEVSSRGELIR